MADRWSPPLELRECGDRCRLWLGGWAYGEGETLQQAGDALVARVRDVAVRIRRSGLRYPAELGRPDVRELEYLWELGEMAARGDDLRERVLGFA
jgi:hypothetical protein